MATRIPDMRIERLKVATYLELMVDVYETCRQDATLARMMARPMATLKAQTDELQGQMEESKKSQYTALISQKDTQRDSALVMAKTLLHNTVLNGTQEQQVAAKFLEEMAKLPKVKVTPQYDQQTGEITVAVNELLGKYSTYTDASGIRPQVEQLKRLNDEMCELLILRDTEKGAQGPSRIAEIRKKMDVTYRDFIDQINAIDLVYQLGQLSGNPTANPTTAFIDHLLGQIDRFKREILRTGSTGTGGGTTDNEEVEEDTTPGGSGSTGEGSGSTEGGSGSTEEGGSGSTEEGGETEGGSGSNTGGGSTEGGSGSTGGSTGSNETPTDPTKILLLFNDGAHGNVIVKRMEVEPGYQLTAADLPEGYVYAFKNDDQADIDAASPGDTVWVTLAPRG